MREHVDPALDLLRLENLVRFVEETEPLEGEVVECGVYRGSTLVIIALWLERLGSMRRAHGFDSFEGLPEPSMHDRTADNGQRAIKGYLADTSEELVRAKARQSLISERVRLCRGPFEATLSASLDFRVSLVHLDCDLFESYRICLARLWPRLQPGGVIIFDEFENPNWPGARVAIDEFFRGRNERPMRLSFQQAYVRKLP